MVSLYDADLDVVCQLSEDRHYDFIVIGSGIGGGIVARQLIAAKKTVLVLEKGGLLFSSHCLNTSRPHWQIGDIKGPSQDNDVVFGAVKSRVQLAEGSDPYVGGPVYCLGGRSTVWGLFSPELDAKTLGQHFPLIKDQLTRRYPDVFKLFCGHTINYPCVPGAQDTEVENNEVEAKKKWMEEALKAAPDIKMLSAVEEATIAAEFIAENWYTIPQGAYSTVDHLLDRLYAKSEFLTVVLNADVLCLQTTEHNEKAQDLEVQGNKDDGGKASTDQPKAPLRSVTDVVFRDKLGRIRRVKATRAVVLCAGTIGSAKIALSSNLHQANELVGTGLTDHEIWGIRFKTHKKFRKSEPLLALKVSDPAQEAAEKAGKQPLKLQCMVDVHQKPALLNICVNADAFLGKGSSILQGNTHFFGGTTTSDDITNTLNITFQYEAQLDPGSKVLNVPTHDPVIKIKREGIYGGPDDSTDRMKWQNAMLNLAIGIASKFVAEIEPPLPADSDEERSTKSPVLENISGDKALSMKLADFGVVAHEVGTLRMQTRENRKGHEDGAAWVVDKDLKFRDIDNLFVCDLSVFPVSPPANPTPTLAALALRLADYLLKFDRGERDAPNDKHVSEPGVRTENQGKVAPERVEGWNDRSKL